MLKKLTQFEMLANLNNMKHKSHISPIIWMISISTLVLFICSSIRHELFHSTAFDLGILIKQFI